MRKGGISVNYGDTVTIAETNVENRQNNELFVDHRRGEVNELYEKLQNITQIKDREKRIELFQKVIALMTLGVDVSCLYSLMILASATQDQVEKKIIYLYLTYYAEKNSELALLIVNTLRKDSEDEDPVIRSLALKSFSSLKVPIAIEYIEPILKNGLNDMIGYVRKTAVMGCLKFFKYSKEDFMNSQLLNILFSMLDTELDPHTIINLIYVLNEINKDKGGMEFSKEFIFKILNNIKSFNEWSQFTILKLVLTYIPQIVNDKYSEKLASEEVYHILNVLDDIIRHSSVTTLLLCIQIFILLTKSYPCLFTQVIQRLKAPLFTQASTSIPEISYIVYAHLRLLFSFISEYSIDGKEINSDSIDSHKFYSSSLLCYFEDEYQLLFIRNGDPFYIKNIKLDLIPFVFSENNALFILEELYHYSYELYSNSLIHKSIYLMSIVIIKYTQIQLDNYNDLNDSIEIIKKDDIIKTYVNYIEDLLDSEKEEILSPTLMGLELIIESFPWLVLETIAKFIDFNLVEKLTFRTDGINSLLWIITKYPDSIQDDIATILDNVVNTLIETFDESINNNNSQELSSKLFSIVLTSCCRLLFYSPDDIRPILGRLLSFTIEKLDYPEVKDQALFYYRLLQHDYKLAKIIINDEPTFNKPENMLNSVNILKDYFYRWKKDTLFQDFNTCSIIFDNLKFSGQKMDFFGYYSNDETIKRKSTDSVQKSIEPLIKFNFKYKNSAIIHPDEFEEKWNLLKNKLETQLEIKVDRFLDFEFLSDIEEELAKNCIYCIASGQVDDDTFKLFSYCIIEDIDHSIDVSCLSELTINYLFKNRTYCISSCIKGWSKDNKVSDFKFYSNEMWNSLKFILEKHLN